jgi:iron-sulfur cluster repair protein YtfE (RIC family)
MTILEELRSEKRILTAEREETVRILLSIQRDFEDIAAMEQKVVQETAKIERDLDKHLKNEEYLEVGGIKAEEIELISEKIANLRQEHNLPELPRLARNLDAGNAQYLQSRLDNHMQQNSRERRRE